MTMTESAVEQVIADDIAFLSAGADSDGYRPIGSEFAIRTGFTEDLFEGYLWESGKSCFVSAVFSKQPGKGNFGRLLANIESLGFSVKVPCPLAVMQSILTRKGFGPSVEDPMVWCRRETSVNCEPRADAPARDRMRA